MLGFLPEALINYFGRLGWSLDDKTEIMPLETMIANFGLDRVNDSPASFDPEKLHWVAGEYMRMAPVERKVEGVIPILQRAGLLPPLSPVLWGRGVGGEGGAGTCNTDNPQPGTPSPSPPTPLPLSTGGEGRELVDRDKIAKVVQACGDRLKIFADVLNYGAFFFRDPQYDRQGGEATPAQGRHRRICCVNLPRC